MGLVIKNRFTGEKTPISDDAKLNIVGTEIHITFSDEHKKEKTIVYPLFKYKIELRPEGEEG